MSANTCDRHPSALAKYVAAKATDNGALLELTLCGHCRVKNAGPLFADGWDVIDADQCDTLRAPDVDVNARIAPYIQGEGAL